MTEFDKLYDYGLMTRDRVNELEEQHGDEVTER